MQRITRSAIHRSAWAASGTALTLGLFACGGVDSSSPPVTQQDFGYTTLNLITKDGLKFKDMDKSGQLEPYEDWRLSAEVRARDLVGRLTLAEKAGLMMHGTAPVLNDTTGAGTGSAYLAALKTLINQRGVNTYITRMSADAHTMAVQANQIQTLAEQSRLGIPVTISSDPRNHFQYTLGASAGSSGFSQWPETLGFAAIGDAALTRNFGDIARQEYRAVGITEALSPQADLATEPRWAHQRHVRRGRRSRPRAGPGLYRRLPGRQRRHPGQERHRRRQALGRIRRAETRLRQPQLLRPLCDLSGQQFRLSPEAVRRRFRRQRRLGHADLFRAGHDGDGRRHHAGTRRRRL